MCGVGSVSSVLSHDSDVKTRIANKSSLFKKMIMDLCFGFNGKGNKTSSIEIDM